MEKLLSRQIVFECPVFKVEEAEVEIPDGSRQKRWYVVKRDAVGVIGVDDDGQLLLTREYRSAAGSVRWRIPAGSVQEGESPEEAAHRELREELGIDCRILTPLMEAKSPSGLIKQTTHFYLGREFYESPLESGEWEDIQLVPTDPAEARKLLDAGELQGNIGVAVRRALSRLEDGSP